MFALIYLIRIHTACEVNAELALPTKNVYIATKFTLVEDILASEFPVMVDQSDHYRLWYKPDTIFESYKGNNVQGVGFISYIIIIHTL